MTKETPLRKIMKKRNLTLRKLYFLIKTEISLSRLSDIRVGRIVPEYKEIEILNKYLKLSENEFEELRNMEVNQILIEKEDDLINLLNLVPKDLKQGDFIIEKCPKCNSRLKIGRSNLNGHLCITCEKEGVLLIQ